ncbi:MAG: hypothetical protein ACYTEL_26050, partial [Planctomycetota bacterium]
MKAKQFTLKSNVLILIGFAYAFTLILPQLSNAMYDPKHGRWLQRDPNGTKINQSIPSPDDLAVPPNQSFMINPKIQYEDGMNLYVYVKDSPTSAIDPHGFLTSNMIIIYFYVRCMKYAEQAMQDTENNRLIELLRDNGCPNPGPYCGCCVVENASGEIDYSTGEVRLCMNNIPSQQKATQYLYHELVHACHACIGEGPLKMAGNTCEGSVASEIKAYDADCTCAASSASRQTYERCIAKKVLASISSGKICGSDLGLIKRIVRNAVPIYLNNPGKCDKSCYKG